MFIADFHIHSSYSRATSRECVPEILELWARRKGLHLIGTGDFTHPAWREELKEKLVPAEEGLLTLKKEFRQNGMGEDFVPRFIVSGEISSIYKKNGRVRKVHNLILLPGLREAEALSMRLQAMGANLHSDGRPILGLDSHDLLEITLEACPKAIFIPAHIWTPHFSLFGAYSGFDDIKECFEDLTPYIHALETGLSSDPSMNWRLSALDAYTLVSNSDAHSPANLAREANLFDTELSYSSIAKALDKRNSGFTGTLEFFPEEGKYHFDGHRSCKVCLAPSETRAASGICPVCGGRITVGVLSRVEALADREEGFTPPSAAHFENLIPLHEVIAASMGLTPASKKVREQYETLIGSLGNELFILREAPLDEIERKAGPCVAEGIKRLRQGRVEVHPGYDGEYGKIKILDRADIDRIWGQFCFLAKEELQNSIPAPKLTPAKTSPKTNQEIKEKAVWATGDILYGLNSEQWDAASCHDRVVSVIAGPGTGKTRTLVYRIAYLVEKCGVPPAQITAVTFTNKAAQEMRERLEKHFGDKRIVRAMAIGTFHSICIKLLAGWQQPFTLIDEYEAGSVVSDVLESLHLKTSPREILKGISKIKSGAGQPQVPHQVYDAYTSLLGNFNVLDYDDILLRVLERFEGTHETGLLKLFTHLLVDEFQDINDIQYRLILEWGKKSDGIFVIGDPDQSIYGFRGSDARCFERLKADFPDHRQIVLSKNYRSTPQILGCALKAISTGIGEPRCLYANREGGARVRILNAQDSFSEALFIAKEINRMVGGMDMLDAHSPSGQSQVHTRGFSDIAVLYRTHRQADILEQNLSREGIPFVVAGRDEFLADRQVRFALSFFRYLLDPADIFSLNGTLKACEQEPAVRQKILEAYTLEKNLNNLSAILSNYPALQNLSDLIIKYAPLVRKEKPVKLVESWVIENGLSGTANMERLCSTALMHAAIPAFLQNLVLGGESDVVRSGGKKYTPDAVSLMTLHGAKGLEFPVVFLCGVSDGIIPLKNMHENDEDEERRLFYVGITRAQDELVLLTSSDPSPFISGFSPEYSLTGAALAHRPVQGRQLNLFDITG